MRRSGYETAKKKAAAYTADIELQIFSDVYAAIDNMLTRCPDDVSTLRKMLRAHAQHLSDCLRCAVPTTRAPHSNMCCMAGAVWTHARRSTKERVAVMHFFAVTEPDFANKRAAALRAGAAYDSAKSTFEASLRGMANAIRTVKRQDEKEFLKDHTIHVLKQGKQTERETFKLMLQKIYTNTIVPKRC